MALEYKVLWKIIKFILFGKKIGNLFDYSRKIHNKTKRNWTEMRVYLQRFIEKENKIKTDSTYKSENFFSLTYTKYNHNKNCILLFIKGTSN